jgi:uncharacterized membrane protein YvbJ
MKLIKCKACGKEKANSAKICPHCGYKRVNIFFELAKLIYGLFFLIIFGIIAYAVFSCMV